MSNVSFNLACRFIDSFSEIRDYLIISLIPLALKFVFLQFRKFTCSSSFSLIFLCELCHKNREYLRYSSISPFSPAYISHLSADYQTFLGFWVLKSQLNSSQSSICQSFSKKIVKIFRVCFDFDRKEDRNTNGENHATFWQNTVCSFTGLKVAILAKNKPARCQSTVFMVFFLYWCLDFALK